MYVSTTIKNISVIKVRGHENVDWIQMAQERV
jgi:hypothetical protein